MVRKLAAVLSAALVLGACTGQPSSDATGEQIYRQICANCHGPNLEGRVGPALGPGSNAATQPDSYLETTILRGRGSMPSFRSTLDDEQVQRVISFIREVQGG
nr:MAG: hypothetical protein DIU67_08385 [Actinomycetota bacterium]